MGFGVPAKAATAAFASRRRLMTCSGSGRGAVSRMRSLTSSAVRVGDAARTRAATPAASGAAIEVPAQTPVLLPGVLLVMPTPGDMMSTLPSRCELSQSLSSDVLAPIESSPS